MGGWYEAYEELDEQRQQNVQRWIHLNKFIAKTLGIPEESWFEDYLGDAMENPLDYSFMMETIPGLNEAQGLDVAGQGEQFLQSIGSDAVGPKVPLRAENNLGRFSPELQDELAGLIENGEPESVKLKPGDVVHLQKVFRQFKPLAKLKRPDFRQVLVVRDFADEEIVISVEGGEELGRLNVMEFAGMLSRKLV